MSLRIPSHSEGRCATYRRGAGMRWTRMALLTRALEADGEIVGFRHPHAGVKFASSGARATVAKVQGSPRRPRISRKATAQGKSDVSAGPVCSCAFFCATLHTRPRVPARIRLSLRPLMGEGVTSKSKPRATGAARSRSYVIASFRRRRHSGACEARTRNLEIPGLVLRTIPE